MDGHYEGKHKVAWAWKNAIGFCFWFEKFNYEVGVVLKNFEADMLIQMWFGGVTQEMLLIMNKSMQGGKCMCWVMGLLRLATIAHVLMVGCGLPYLVLVRMV